MMKLYYSPNSPYARKVRALIIDRDLGDKVELVPVETSDLNGPLLQVNPLGKVPTLDAGADGIVHDSPVICEYLDGFTSSSSGPGKVIDIKDKCLAAVAQGILDAGYATRMEKQRPENLQWQDWKDKQFGKINRALDQLEKQIDNLPTETTIGALGLACTLEWIQFRHPEGNWLDSRPQLNRWLATFSGKPCMTETRPG